MTQTSQSAILVVDDDESTRSMLLALLRAHGYGVTGVATGAAALEALARVPFELTLLDLQLPDMSGVDVMVRAQATSADTEFVLITAHGSVDTAVDAMKRGAWDYLRKPLRTEELLLVIKRVLAATQSRREMAQLKRQAADGMRGRLLGRSAMMEQLWQRIEQVAPTRTTVLITGETGVGKELVARSIHELSPRARERFVPSNCSSLPETLLESELFGHVKGSFTGAVSSRTGLFEEASRGTLFLDEISTISPGIQVKLLRVVQERIVQRVGSNTPIPIDLRLLAATNVDLAAEMERGNFRHDLYYRLNVYPLHVPALRERRDDIPLLARHFLLRKAEEAGVEPPQLPDSTMNAMAEYDWPGNVRELENWIESAVVGQRDRGALRFRPPDSPQRRHALLDQARTGAWQLTQLERERILQALAETSGHRSKAAALLGIDRRTLYRKLKSYEKEAATGEAIPSPHASPAAARGESRGQTSPSCSPPV